MYPLFVRPLSLASQPADKADLMLSMTNTTASHRSHHSYPYHYAVKNSTDEPKQPRPPRAWLAHQFKPARMAPPTLSPEQGQAQQPLQTDRNQMLQLLRQNTRDLAIFDPVHTFQVFLPPRLDLVTLQLSLRMPVRP